MKRLLKPGQSFNELRAIRRKDALQRLHDPSKWRFYFEEDLVSIAKTIVGKLQCTYDAVIGIARSGLIPATHISHAIHAPLYSIDQVNKELIYLGGGHRTQSFNKEAKKILVVDDSVYSGYTFREIRKLFPDHDVTTAGCIVRPEAVENVDIYGVLQASPHLFEWHMPNSSFLRGRMQDVAVRGGLAFDFDGVLCHDVPADRDTDDDNYIDYLRNAPLIMRPAFNTIKLIVTFRLEKYREVTLEWLNKWGITCDKLVMCQAPNIHERRFNAGEHKGIALRDSECFGMLESDHRQCQDIADVSGKPVICYGTGEVYAPRISSSTT